MPHQTAALRARLMRMVFLTNGAVLLLTCAAFFAYEFLTFRQAAVLQLSTMGSIIATNSTAALAFDNQDDATGVLQALAAEPHIAVAGLYDAQGRLFAQFPKQPKVNLLPDTPDLPGHHFVSGYLVNVQPVAGADNRRLGTLYLVSDMGAMYERFRLYGIIVGLVILGDFLLAYIISSRLEQRISHPILQLADTARAISTSSAHANDYSLRATKFDDDEVGLLTDAFNQMLSRLEVQSAEQQQAGIKLQAQLNRLDLLNRITRAIGERQDLPSMFGIILRNLEDNLPIDFGCICSYNPFAERLSVSSVGPLSRPTAELLGMMEEAQIPIDQNGLSRCVDGHLVYEPDVRNVQFPFPQRLASGGLHALVAAPLQVEGKVLGVLIATRRAADSFTSADCEFLRQLSEHVALASHQAKLYGALQQAYDDLRQSQRTVLQQERLKALGGMASGIAHDINNAITPAALYLESLLEQDKTLSEKARQQLTTIQRAIEDVAQTVTRMREFYRQREPELVLAPIDLNSLVRQVIDLTRARWRDLPQQRGIMIQLDSELSPNLPKVMGAEGEIRDALTNLIFNAVDAMTSGGTLAICTSVVARVRANSNDLFSVVQVEVSDTGLGMDDETKRRSLEPFFTTKGERGTGLGLAMVYGMTQRHSAEIEIDSTLGKGTTVRLTFPIPEVVSAPAAAAAAAPIAPGQALDILIVDDDPVLLKSLQDILEQDGHRVTPAGSGQAGIDTFRGRKTQGAHFNVVITDLGMPYVDGRMVAANIKEHSPQTPVVLLTGWGQRLLAEHDIPPNVDRLLSKPPKLSDLRSTLAEVTRQAWDQSTKT